ncbi:MAG TPA: hypothetical protein HA306_05715 [Methanosarcina sp.]|nr:hypothetical protein [Methanosarcina sp.]
MHLPAIKRERNLQSVRLFAEGLREVVISILPLIRSGLFFTFAPPEDHFLFSAFTGNKHNRQRICTGKGTKKQVYKAQKFESREKNALRNYHASMYVIETYLLKIQSYNFYNFIIRKTKIKKERIKRKINKKNKLKKELKLLNYLFNI